MIAAEHLLEVIRGGGIAAERVIANQICWPLGGAWVHVDQHRGVGLQEHNVGITLQTGQPSSVSKGGVKVRRGTTLLRCPFSDENFRGGAAVAIVLDGCSRHRSGSVVEVIVDQVWSAERIGNSVRRYYLQVRIDRLNGIIKLANRPS